jgi:ferric-dicitrate binding protein FerR (iron transport regulator)
VESGEIFGSSGEGGLDFTLQLVTPEATALLRGTTFAVFRTGDATCFCLFRGSLEIRAVGSDEILDIEEGQRIFIYRDGREASVEPLDAREIMKLQMIDDAARGG